MWLIGLVLGLIIISWFHSSPILTVSVMHLNTKILEGELRLHLIYRPSSGRLIIIIWYHTSPILTVPVMHHTKTLEGTPCSLVSSADPFDGWITPFFGHIFRTGLAFSVPLSPRQSNIFWKNWKYSNSAVSSAQSYICSITRSKL